VKNQPYYAVQNKVGLMYKTLRAETDGRAEQSVVETNTRESTPHSLTVVTSLAALRGMEAQWRDLETNVQNHISVFQSFDWVMAWAETYLVKPSSTSLHILAGYDGEKLVYIWPLMRTRQIGLSVLTWLTEPFGQYGDVLCRKNSDTKSWLKSSLVLLRRLRDIDLLRLRHVRADSHIASHCVSFFVDAKHPEKAPFLDLVPFATEADYDARYSQVQRKRRKKIRKSLEDIGVVEFSKLPAGSLADTAMQSAISEKNAWLAERGRINRVLGCALHVPFLKNLSRRLKGTVEVVVSEMRAGEKPVSWEIGFRHGGKHFGYITSHVNALTDLSPGRLHMDLSQRACIADGMTQFDLMVPNDAHKESWSSAAVDTNDYYLPLSVAGSAMGHIYLRRLRPLLRDIYYRWTSRKFSFKTFFRPPKSA
jgi:CelD/BcsL family acetyltransferase involved in cellulose biosynthesis